MTDPRDEIARLLEKADQAAYKRGWDAATVAFQEAVEQLRSPPIADQPPLPGFVLGQQIARRGRPSGKVIDIVADCIASKSGMKGVEIVRAAQAIDATIRERTVRTNLRRLKEKKIIWKRNGLWYPKPKPGESENLTSGEVPGQLSH
jgi:hypothetical protein